MTKHKGSCTVAMVKILSSSKIVTTIIGDSGYALFHVEPDSGKLQLYYRSKEQLHSFNFPYQVGAEGDNPSMAISKVHTNI